MPVIPLGGVIFLMNVFCHLPQLYPRRVHAFFDAQNLYQTAKECFKVNYPNFDPIKLAKAATQLEAGRELSKIHFYTGVHKKEQNEFWHKFWMNKLAGLRRAGVDVFFRYLKYSKSLDDAGETIIKPREKGIDVKISIDLIRLAQKREYDIAIIFSQDTDLQEAVDELYDIRKELNIWLKLECAFPFDERMINPRGLNKTHWIRIEKDLYDLCLDNNDYRPTCGGLFK